MKSKRSQEGYMLLDNRHGPPIHPVPGLAASNGSFESATITCSHCHAIVVLNPMRTRERGHCRKCDAYVCDKVECNSGCLPFNKVLDDLQESEYRKLNSGMIMPRTS